MQRLAPIILDKIHPAKSAASPAACRATGISGPSARNHPRLNDFPGSYVSVFTGQKIRTSAENADFPQICQKLSTPD
jgi:hypothetical protein